jgi:hypothetical protein
MHDSQEQAPTTLTARLKGIPVKARIIAAATALCIAGLGTGAAIASANPHQDQTNAISSEQQTPATPTKTVQVLVACEDEKNHGAAFSGSWQAC